MFHMVSLSEKSIAFSKEHVLLYHRITEIALRQKPVQNGHKKTPKVRDFESRNSVRQKQLFLARLFKYLNYFP